MTLQDVKVYLRVDGNSEDVLINDLMKAAEGYMEGAIDDFQIKKEANGSLWLAKAEQAERLLIADWYENRLAVGRPVNAAVTLIITQLQL